MRDSEDQHTVVAMTHGARVLAGAPPDSRPQPVREVRSGGDLQTDQAMRLALLAAIVDSSDDAIVGKTLEGRVLSWNAAAMRIFGYQPAEVIGKSITMIIPPELRGEEEQILEKLRRGQRIEHFDTIRLTKDGRRIPISLTVSPVRDAQGNIVGASKIARDISERKYAEAALVESERRLTAEAEALAKLNESSTRLWRSRTLAEGSSEMLSAAIELLGADDGNVQLSDESGRLSVVAERGLRPAGDAAELSMPLISPDGTRLGMLSTRFRRGHRVAEPELRRLDLYLRQATDFIQRCALEQELRKREEALREADRRKDEFLALLAHELRNPLAPIRYALATAGKPGRTPEQRRRAEEVVDRQVAHMSRLLDDLLDMARITHGALELKRTPTELGSIVSAAFETARPILEARQHAFSVDLPEQPVRLQADAVRLAQAFSNLLINAAKYTPPGGRIELRAARQAGDVLVSIRDNGMGVPAEMLPRLFKLFSQGSTSGSADRGLGVGLALVRQLVALHGGSVEVRSGGAGQGSEFTVRLPVGTVLEMPVAVAAEAECLPVPAMRILVVDDNRDAAEMSAMLLQLSGHTVQTAVSSAQALERGAAFRPHAMLLDIGLPDMSGYELATRVRVSSWGRGTLLVAVTGWGQEHDRRRAVEAGFDHHLTKPVAPETLESILRMKPK